MLRSDEEPAKLQSVLAGRLVGWLVKCSHWQPSNPGKVRYVSPRSTKLMQAHLMISGAIWQGFVLVTARMGGRYSPDKAVAGLTRQARQPR